MRRIPVPKWMHVALMVGSAVLLLCAIVTWTSGHRVQSAGLLAWTALLTLQWRVSKPIA